MLHELRSLLFDARERDSGADFEDLAKQAGHTDPRFTATVYSRDNLEAARRVAQKWAARRSGE